MSKPTVDQMIAFMVSIPPSEHITQDVIRGAMKVFGVREATVNRLYDAAVTSGRVEQGILFRQTRAYQGANQGCFCVRTGFYFWRDVARYARVGAILERFNP